MSVQKRNDELVGNLQADFQRRWEKSFSWAECHGTFVNMPRVRGYWPCSSVDENLNVYDVSGQGRTLTGNNMSDGTDALIPYLSFDGATSYLNRADETGLDFSGTLFMGGYFYINNTGSQQGLMSKWTAAGNDRSYRLLKLANDKIRFEISGNGTTTFTVDSTIVPTIFQWHFIFGWFSGNTEIRVYTDYHVNNNLIGIPATLHNSAADLEVGRSDGANYFDGVCSQLLMCDRAVEDFQVKALYNRTQAFFGIRNKGG